MNTLPSRRTRHHEALHCVGTWSTGGTIKAIETGPQGGRTRLVLTASPGEVAAMPFGKAVAAIVDVFFSVAAPSFADNERMNHVDAGILSEYWRGHRLAYRHAEANAIGKLLPSWLKQPGVKVAVELVTAALLVKPNLKGQALEALRERVGSIPRWRDYPLFNAKKRYAQALDTAPAPAPRARRSPPAPRRQEYTPPVVPDYRGYSVIAASWWPWRKRQHAQGTELDRRPIDAVLADLLMPGERFDPEGWELIPPGMLGHDTPPGRAGGPRQRLIYGPPPCRRRRVELPPLARPKRQGPLSWRQHGQDIFITS